MIMMGSHNFPGTYNFDDVLQMGESNDAIAVQDLQRRLQCDDPINIQFTSVISM